MQWCRDNARVPVQALGPHIAALGMIIYDGTMFPAAFKGSVSIAQHSSWARSQRIGYRVSVVILGPDHCTSVGYDAEFLTGFLLPNNTIWGRPVDLAEMPDGSVLMSDDYFGAVYRITWSRDGRVPPIRYFLRAAAEAPARDAPDQTPAAAPDQALAGHS
ncbi:hypothetical protein WJX81_002284 [Elliptochloris bilobata]|uniref:Uncharacterized protein n=1 Tax=Elliptochloris bilobata TaxID=381761 RepID=A0AAW1QCN0_9CHLO